MCLSWPLVPDISLGLCLIQPDIPPETHHQHLEESFTQHLKEQRLEPLYGYSYSSSVAQLWKKTFYAVSSPSSPGFSFFLQTECSHVLHPPNLSEYCISATGHLSPFTQVAGESLAIIRLNRYGMQPTKESLELFRRLSKCAKGHSHSHLIEPYC